MISKEEILLKLNHNRSIIAEYGVQRIGLFGSYSKNSNSEDSDIDIIVSFSQDKISFDNYIGLKLFLEDLFLKKIDLVIEEDIREQLKDSILSSVVYAA